jgi:hypothetical protein
VFQKRPTIEAKETYYEPNTEKDEQRKTNKRKKEKRQALPKPHT